ncbi:MAG: methyltransferase domain-containing protein [bacterium]|nr:methyltransferase domain-containing protein [bacterium]
MQNEEEKKLHENYYTKSDDSGISRYAWYLERYFKNIKDKKILEIGCGDGGVVQFLKDKNEVYALDISKNAMKFLEQKGIKSFLADVSNERIPFDDCSLDAVIALEVVEHLKSPQHAIEEIQRVLKKNGKLIVSIPNPRTGHIFLYPCLFTLENFKKYLSNNHFFVSSVTTYGICPPFWSRIKSFLAREQKNVKRQLSGRMRRSDFFSKIIRFVCSDSLAFLRPKFFGWSFVYECVNINPRGAKLVYKEIVDQTRKPPENQPYK